MKTEYIFTVDKETDLAKLEQFQKFLDDEIQKINIDTDFPEGKIKIRWKGSIGTIVFCQCDTQIDVCGYELTIKTLISDNGGFVIHTVTFTNSKDCDKDCICRIFETEQKYFHKIIYDNLDKFKEVKIVWDEISEFNAKSTYPEIYETENLMRKVITEFMMINIGNQWEKYIPPKLQSKANNRKDKENDLQKIASILYNLDFIDLTNYLFEPYQRDTDTSKLKSCLTNQAKLSKKVLDFIDMSNWERYFGKILNINEKEFVEKWKKLYKYRCKIAHNNFFTKEDIEETQNLIKEIKEILNHALEILPLGNKLSLQDKFAFIKYRLLSDVKTILTKIVDICEKICILKNWKTHTTDILDFIPANQQHKSILTYFDTYLKSMKNIDKPIYNKMEFVYEHCSKFFSDEVNENDENEIANLPDEMNDLTDRLNFYYLNEKFNS